MYNFSILVLVDFLYYHSMKNPPSDTEIQNNFKEVPLIQNNLKQEVSFDCLISISLPLSTLSLSLNLEK